MLEISAASVMEATQKAHFKAQDSISSIEVGAKKTSLYYYNRDKREADERKKQLQAELLEASAKCDELASAIHLIENPTIESA